MNHPRITTNMVKYKMAIRGAAPHTHKDSVIIFSILKSGRTKHP